MDRDGASNKNQPHGTTKQFMLTIDTYAVYVGESVSRLLRRLVSGPPCT